MFHWWLKMRNKTIDLTLLSNSQTFHFNLPGHWISAHPFTKIMRLISSCSCASASLCQCILSWLELTSVCTVWLVAITFSSTCRAQRTYIHKGSNEWTYTTNTVCLIREGVFKKWKKKNVFFFLRHKNNILLG